MTDWKNTLPFKEVLQRKTLDNIVSKIEEVGNMSSGYNKMIALDKPLLILDIDDQAYSDLTAEAWLDINLSDYIDVKVKRVRLQVWSKYEAIIKAPGAGNQTVRSFEWRVLFPIISDGALATSPEWAGDITGFNLCTGFGNRTNSAGTDDDDKSVVQSGYMQLRADIKPDTNLLQYYLSRVMYKGDATTTTDTTKGNILHISTKVWLTDVEE